MWWTPLDWSGLARARPVKDLLSAVIGRDFAADGGLQLAVNMKSVWSPRRVSCITDSVHTNLLSPVTSYILEPFQVVLLIHKHHNTQ